MQRNESGAEREMGRSESTAAAIEEVDGRKCVDAPRDEVCKTPPCFPFPPRWNYSFAPVLAPKIVRPIMRLGDGNNQRVFPLSTPLDEEPFGNRGSETENPSHSERLGYSELARSATLQNCSNSNPHCADTSSDGKVTHETNENDGVRIGAPKRSFQEVFETRLKTENILGAFKCVKMRKHE